MKAIEWLDKRVGPEGMELHEFHQALQGIAAATKDFVAPADKMKFSYSEQRVHLNLLGLGVYPLRPLCERQVASKLGIPGQFYERARRHHDEMIPLMNKLLQDYGGDSMVRTLDGEARAFLSSSYRRIDNFQVAGQVVEALAQVGEFKVKSVALTDTRMFMKFTFPGVRAEVKKGDIVESGIMVQNSEVGTGAFSVVPFIYRLVCLNGLIINESKIRRRHVGRNLLGDQDDAFEVTNDDTWAAENQALVLKIRDLIIDTVDKQKFEATVLKLQEAQGQQIMGHPEKAIKMLGNQFRLNETTQGAVLRQLIEGADLSRYGVVNAFTQAAQGVDQYHQAVELEESAGLILNLQPDEWSHVATAE